MNKIKYFTVTEISMTHGFMLELLQIKDVAIYPSRKSQIVKLLQQLNSLRIYKANNTLMRLIWVKSRGHQKSYVAVKFTQIIVFLPLDLSILNIFS